MRPAACPLCGSAKTSRVSTRDRFGRRVRTKLCEDCGLVFNFPAADAAELMQAHVDDNLHECGPGGAPEIARTVRILARMERAIPEYWPLLKNRRRVLDAAAGHGEFAYVMRSLGFTVEALEPCQQLADYCQTVLGLPVEVANFAEKEYAAGSFDFIRVHHVLVHCRDPVAVLRRMRPWLSDTGLLYLELPNVEAEADVKPRGDVFDIGHAFNFNPQTLRAAAAAAGFAEMRETQTRHSGTTAGFFQKADPQPVAPDPANARRVSDAITRNYRGSKPLAAKIGRLVDHLAERAAEKRDMRGLTDHRTAADHYAERLRARLNA